MNTKDYVSYNTAKLLERAGYPQNSEGGYYDGETLVFDLPWDNASDRLAAPHLWDALKWLREMKSISVEVACVYRTKFFADVYTIADRYDSEGFEVIANNVFTMSYESACDAGIAAACKWLIKKNRPEK